MPGHTTSSPPTDMPPDTPGGDTECVEGNFNSYNRDVIVYQSVKTMQRLSFRLTNITSVITPLIIAVNPSALEIYGETDLMAQESKTLRLMV